MKLPPGGTAGLARRLAGLALAGLALTPAFRLAGGSGPGAAAVAEGAAGHYAFLWIGLAAVGGAALLLALADRGGWAERGGAALAAAVCRPSRARFAAGVGLLGALLAAAAALVAFRGDPYLLDTSVQLAHARYLAEGRLAGPELARPAFRAVQFTLNTPHGWVSQYPPGQVAVLGAGLAAGLPWAPVAMLHGATALFAALVGERLLERPAVARLGGLAVAASPFLLALAGAGMSHVPAAALAAAAAWLALRAVRGGGGWAAAAGAAAGLLFAVRPLSGVVLGSVATAGVWLARRPRGPGVAARESAAPAGAPPPPGAKGMSRGWLLRRLGLAAAGALPAVAAVLLYNAHFFGEPATFGYVAAAGPSAAPGFHATPWGDPYGPARAVGYTAADLLGLDGTLLRSPLPVVPLVAAFLLFRSRLTPGERVLAGWALLPVLAGALYWHHDLALGPRMLGESAPAWCLLAVAAAAWVVRRVPAGPLGPGGVRPRRGLLGAIALTLAAGPAVLGPAWLLGYRSERLLSRVTPPETGEPAVVFVHDSWRDRLGARLHARGLRLDSLRAVLSTHPPCRVQGMLDLVDEPELGGRELVRRCRRQRRADRHGTLDLASFLWRGDLPGLAREGAAFVRDMGPARNRRFLEDQRGRSAAGFLLPAEEGSGVRLVSYRRGVDLLWGGADGSEAGAAARGGEGAGADGGAGGGAAGPATRAGEPGGER